MVTWPLSGIARLATESNVFPVYEVENGVYKINKKIKNPKPVSEYLKLQGRFLYLKDNEIEYIQGEVNKNWKRLLKLEEAFGTPLDEKGEGQAETGA